MLHLEDIQQAEDSRDLFRGRVGSKSVAVKVYRWGCHGGNIADKRKSLEEEISALSHLSCEGATPILGLCYETEGIMQQLPGVVTSWMHNGNILQFCETFPYVDRVTLLADIANHLESLHSVGIVHGNLHPRNILIDESCSPLLADFRLRTMSMDSKLSRKENGYNARYRSPEETISPMMGGAIHSASDVYSFACTCLEVLTFVPPFAGLASSTDVVLSLHSGHSPYNANSFNMQKNMQAYHPSLFKVLEHCLHPNAAMRPKMSTVLKAFSILGESVGKARVSEKIQGDPWIANVASGKSYGTFTRKFKL